MLTSHVSSTVPVAKSRFHVRPPVLALAGITLGIAIGVGLTWAETRDKPLEFTHRAVPAEPTVKTIVIDPIDDEGKAGSVRGVMGQKYFEAPIEGGSSPSENGLRFEFTAPAELLGLDLSIDINDPRMTLAEFAVGVNPEEGWGWDGQAFDRRADWLMMTSWSNRPLHPGQIDETITLPEGVEVGAGDFIGLVGWLGGSGTGGPLRVSPELVVLYRWL